MYSVTEISSGNADGNKGGCWCSCVMWGSEHALDSMCLTKAAKLVIDWWLLPALWKLLGLHSGEVTAEVSGALCKNCC